MAARAKPDKKSTPPPKPGKKRNVRLIDVDSGEDLGSAGADNNQLPRELDNLDNLDDDPDPALDAEVIDDGDFAGLFEADAEGRRPEVVLLYRDSPKATAIDPITNTEFALHGYLTKLPPGLIEYRSWIQEQYGGGKFRAQRKIKDQVGRIVINKVETMEIAGPPRLPRPEERRVVGPTETANPAAAPSHSSLPGDQFIERDGVKIPLNLDTVQLEALAARMRALDIIFPKRVDINDTLLQLALKRPDDRGTDPLRQIETVGSLIGAVRELIPEPAQGSNGNGDGGTDLLGLVKSGIEAFRDYVQASRANAPRPRPGLVAAPPAPAAQLPEQITSAEIEPAESISQDEGTQPMNLLQMVTVAVANIRAGFLLNPRMESRRVVQVLDTRLNLNKEQRANVANYRDHLWDQARMSMVEDFNILGEDCPTIELDFEAYFQEVFNQYVDAERKTASLAEVKL